MVAKARITGFSIMINKSLLDLLKIFTEPTLVLAIIKEMSLQ